MPSTQGFSDEEIEKIFPDEVIQRDGKTVEVFPCNESKREGAIFMRDQFLPKLKEQEKLIDYQREELANYRKQVLVYEDWQLDNEPPHKIQGKFILLEDHLRKLKEAQEEIEKQAREIEELKAKLQEAKDYWKIADEDSYSKQSRVKEQQSVIESLREKLEKAKAERDEACNHLQRRLDDIKELESRLLSEWLAASGFAEWISDMGYEFSVGGGRKWVLATYPIGSKRKEELVAETTAELYTKWIEETKKK